MKESFSKRMKEAMDIRNLKQVELVEKTKLNKSAISQYVSGKYEPKQVAIYELSHALDVNEAWLMGYDCPMQRCDFDSKINSKKLSEEVILIESIQKIYGNNAVKLLKSFSELNTIGKEKAIENIDDLLQISKYTTQEKKLSNA